MRPNRRRIKPGAGEPVGIGQRQAVDPFRGQHFAGGPIPVDKGHAELGIVRDIFREFGSRRRLKAKIHLDAHRARERLDDFDGLQPTHVRRQALRQSRREEHIGEIARKAPLDAWPQDFDRDFARRLAVLHAGAMHLGDRGGGHRFAEFEKQCVQLHAEGRFDRRDRDAARMRRNPVLQPLELRDDFGADDIGPGRKELAELHIGRAEPIDRGRQAAETFGAAPRQKIGERERRARQGRQYVRIDIDECALARQHEAGAGKAGAMAEICQQPQI